ncbi:MAG: hypothetical protein Q4G02_01395 [bacterium]|nr:hypothetical protein [bacterium]
MTIKKILLTCLSLSLIGFFACAQTTEARTWKNCPNVGGKYATDGYTTPSSQQSCGGSNAYCNLSSWQTWKYSNKGCRTRRGVYCDASCKISCSGGQVATGYVDCSGGWVCGNDERCPTGCEDPCTKATCRDYGYSTSPPVCEGSAETITLGDDCGGNITCYTGQCKCQTCENLGYLSTPPTCIHGYETITPSNECGGALTCYKKNTKTCASPEYQTLGYLGNYNACGSYHLTYSGLNDGCNNNLSCYQCCPAPDPNKNFIWVTDPNQCTEGLLDGIFPAGATTVDGKKCYQCDCSKETKCDEGNNWYNTCDKLNADGSIAIDYDCDPPTPFSDPCGNITLCYKRKTCQEMEPPKKTQGDCIDGQIFVHIDDGCAAYDINQPCGQCTDVSSNWLQGINGNFYAQGKVDMTISSTITYYYMQGEGNNQTVAENTIDNVFDNKFLLRHNGAFNANKNISSSLAIIGGNNLVLNNMDVTQREVSNTQAASTLGSPSNRKEDFNYFKNLVAYDKLASCGGGLNSGSVINNGYVCKFTHDTTLGNITIADGVKQVVFVDGNLTINGDIAVPETSYLAIIVSGDITFDPNLGTNVFDFENDIEASWNQKPAVNGVFIASGKLLFPAHSATQVNEFTKYPCAPKLTLGGTFVGWEGVDVKRSFIGCAKTKPSLTNPYQNYNAKIPVLTFQYRPEFVLNTPDWMKQIARVTVESN